MRKRKIFQVASATAMYFVLGFFILLILVIFIAFIAGLRVFSVASPSMQPAIPQGSVIVVSNRRLESIETGDVITFRVPSGENLTHRVIVADYEADRIITQGDMNNVPDSPISYNAVIGRVVFHSHRLDAIFSFIVSPAGIALLVGLPLVTVFMNALVQKICSQKDIDKNIQEDVGQGHSE